MQCNNRIEDRYGGKGGRWGGVRRRLLRGSDRGPEWSVRGWRRKLGGTGLAPWCGPWQSRVRAQVSLGLLYLFPREPFLPSCLVGHPLQTSQGPVCTFCILKWPAPFSLCRPCLATDFWLPDLPNVEHSLPSPFDTHWGQALDTFLTSALLQLPDQAPFSPALFLRASSL